MFNLLGIGERAGSGLENIQLAWKEQQWLAPDLEELYDPDRIVLTLRTISMLPEQSIMLLKAALRNKYNELKREEVMALVAADQEEYVTNNRLQQLLDTHAINSHKILSSLVDKGYLEADGIGRGTKYYLTELFKNVSNGNINDIDNDDCDKKSVVLGEDEKKVLDYIIKNESINTKKCISELGFGRTKSKEIFNALIQLDKIKRIGAGSKIRYVLVDSNVEE
ncbi:hypothetical protein [Haloimpatiens lingqiaonensis]|uniref:hypothetical protein n=1 Tax=Haloimpatiens lingqiaonensis TaxID=1380675 RepID=UPI001FAAECF1|nr:hypothetical protein [Haloimpatiens lingqiaonensis]